jgi:hypothetical protein
MNDDAAMTDDDSPIERDWVTRFDELDDAGKRNSREGYALHDKMRRQRKVIWRLAQPRAKGGDGRGWHRGHRPAWCGPRAT